MDYDAIKAARQRNQQMLDDRYGKGSGVLPNDYKANPGPYVPPVVQYYQDLKDTAQFPPSAHPEWSAFAKDFPTPPGREPDYSLTQEAEDYWRAKGNRNPPPQDHYARGGQITQTGPIKAPTPGRQDQYPKDVPDGSYVFPADVVSALGQGNTDAGHQTIAKLFPQAPKGRDGLMRHKKIPPPARKMARGGLVPIIVAGGEHIITPEQVAFAGGGDVNSGKQICDQIVNAVRADNIDTLQRMPPPKG